MTHVHLNPEKDSGSSPTAQTREGTTLLMWFRLEECDLVEESEPQDLGNHLSCCYRVCWGHSDKPVEAKVNRDMHGVTFHKNQPFSIKCFWEDHSRS